MYKVEETDFMFHCSGTSSDVRNVIFFLHSTLRANTEICMCSPFSMKNIPLFYTLSSAPLVHETWWEEWWKPKKKKKLFWNVMFTFAFTFVYRNTSSHIDSLIIRWYREETKSNDKKMKYNIQMEMRNIILICERYYQHILLGNNMIRFFLPQAVNLMSFIF